MITFSSKVEAALFFFGFGFAIIPIVPNQKKPAVKYSPWLDDLSEDSIKRYWEQHPDDDIGFVLNEEMLVLDTDSPESDQALTAIMMEHGAPPKFIVKTKRGSHCYFRLAPGTFAKPDSHDCNQHPDRIDVRAHHNSMVLPPSGGREISVLYAEHQSQLTEVDQEFVDAIFLHNGRPVPRPHPERSIDYSGEYLVEIATLEELLEYIDPDSGYNDWLAVLMALFNATGGSDEGLALADRWSRKGNKYEGPRSIEAKWRSFSLDAPHQFTIATLIKLAAAAGADIPAIMMKSRDEFEPCECEIVNDDLVESGHPLAAYLLNGSSQRLAKELRETKFVLADIALSGQGTVIYAAPNAGKTLITLHLLIEAIGAGRIEASDVFYLNFDDTAKGLVEKVTIAETYRFGMLADGHEGFDVADFVEHIQQIIKLGRASKTILILDTLKKFTNLMDKAISSKFTKLIRSFISKGGTFIALAHTNKNLQDGKAIPSGTSDIPDDMDCIFVLQTVSDDAEARRVVEFTNRKRRGNVTSKVAYSYSTERGISYLDLLSSVQLVDPDGVASLRQAANLQQDAKGISAIEACIREGITNKMLIRDEASKRSGASQHATVAIIDSYTGTDVATHRWTYDVQARGAKVFRLLDHQPEDPGGP